MKMFSKKKVVKPTRLLEDGRHNNCDVCMSYEGDLIQDHNPHPHKCEQCGSKEKTYVCGRTSFDVYCKKCMKIIPPYLHMNKPANVKEQLFQEQHCWIWNGCIKDEGIEFYKGARDKLIKKLEAREKKATQKEMLRKRKLKEGVMNWK